ncbi:MAG TPA: phosphate starvation-inducible protein PhoH, partial [Thermosipho africanus]|nr:phosphate starvation-inducible protein PhoH [Thermosipho africanus]
IDTPYLDKDSNGLVYAATKFLNSKLSAHVVLKKGERSLLASEAANLL